MVEINIPEPVLVIEFSDESCVLKAERGGRGGRDEWVWT